MSNYRDSFSLPYSIDHCLKMLDMAATSKKILKRHNLKDVDTELRKKNAETAYVTLQTVQTIWGFNTPTARMRVVFQKHGHHSTQLTYTTKTPLLHYVLILMSFGIGLWGLTSIFWANQSPETSCFFPFGTVFIVGTMGMLGQQLTTRLNLSALIKDTFAIPYEDQGLHKSDWVMSFDVITGLVAFVLGVISLILLLTLNFDVGKSTLPYQIALFIIICTPFIYTFFMPIVSATLLFQPLRRGDYQKVFSQLRFHQVINPVFALWSSVFQQIKGIALLNAGFFDEAERLYRALLPSEKQKSDDDKSKNIAPNYSVKPGNYESWMGLGNVYMARQLYDAALQFYEQAKNADDERSGVYFGLAELYISMGNNPQLALENLVQAEKFADTSWLGRMFDEHALPRIYAARAWAYAQMQQFEQAENAIMQALEPRPRDFYPGQADLHYKIGQTKLLMNDPASAKQHFQLAADFDPNGYSGNLARQALNELF